MTLIPDASKLPPAASARPVGRDPAQPVRIVEPGRTPGPRHVDPMLALEVRAVLLDATILLTSTALCLAVLVRADYIQWGPETVLFGAGLSAGWLVSILVCGGYEVRYLGVGSEEFKRMLIAALALLAAISIVAYLFPVDPPLRIVLPLLGLGLVLLLGGRWRLRAWLGRQRKSGRFLRETLLVGERLHHASLAEAFTRDVTSGFKAVGAVQPPIPGADVREVEAWLDGVMRWIDEHDVRAVAVVESAATDVEVLRRLAWRLEAPRIDLLVSPFLLSDVAGPRVSVRPAAGLPLLHLDEPALTGPKRVLKRLLDLVLMVPALVILSPLFIGVGIAIRLDSPGRVFYVSQRVGRAGAVFGCLKFRTMCDGADALRAEVIGDPDADIAARYREDPRVTKVGRWLRRWSLDELPQLLNVVGGSMSLVGPRPMLPEELGLLADVDHRRHLTKPGITGLWQISGRKEVAWEDRMRLDLYYLERWSVALDLIILMKTAKAVVSGKGAY